MDPVCEELGDLLAFPLGGHVSSAVNSCEVETIVADEITGDLSISVPWVPVFLDGPVKLLDPSACAIGWDSTIGISRIKEHFVTILFHNLIDPEGALILISIVFIYSVIALNPSLNRVRNV